MRARLPPGSEGSTWPMPGSPPTKRAEPRTKPPPVARSSSLMPETMRGAFLDLAGQRGERDRPPLARRPQSKPGPEPMPPVEPSSTSVFHSPQPSHLPAQRVCTVPAILADELNPRLSHRPVLPRDSAGHSGCRATSAFHRRWVPAAAAASSIGTFEPNSSIQSPCVISSPRPVTSNMVRSMVHATQDRHAGGPWMKPVPPGASVLRSGTPAPEEARW